MTRAEICVAIAEKLEPKPEDHVCGLTGFSVALGDSCPVCMAVEQPSSELWRFVRGAWFPLDFFTNESASAMLLESMPEPTLAKNINQWECEARYRCGPAAVSLDRKTAVVLAKCRELGIEPGEIC